jgi:GNAT superfamily N-acetyltransferase
MIEVRRAQPGDAPAVAEVHVRSWQVGYRGLVRAEYLAGLRPGDRARRYDFDRMPPAGPLTLIALDDATVCGHVTTGVSRDDDSRGAGEIRAIYVDPPRWGSGVGRALLTAAVEELRAAGHGVATLWVLSGNVRARRFYEHCGWRWDGAERTDRVGGGLVHEIRYRRSLATE